MDEKLTIFIAVTSIAVVLQMLILAGMAFMMWKLSTQLRSTTEDVKKHAIPLLENGNHISAEIKRIMQTSEPKVELVLDNAAAISTNTRSALGRIETTLNDLLDRTRLQVIRADEMITRVMDRVEETTEKVAHTVTSPVKQASGIMHGISTGLGTYFGNKKSRKPGPSDEMFI